MGRRLAIHLLLALSLVASGLASAVHVAAHSVSGTVEAVHAGDHAGHDHGSRLPGIIAEAATDDAHADDPACLGYHLFCATYGVPTAPPGALRVASGDTVEGVAAVGHAPRLRPIAATIRGPPAVS